MHGQTIWLRETVLGKEHPDTLTSINNLAQVLSRRGKYEEAEKIYRQALGLKETVLGKEHPSTLTSVIVLPTYYIFSSGLLKPAYSTRGH
jgi:tetratricopeptide (TPR) repeat protein